MKINKPKINFCEEKSIIEALEENDFMKYYILMVTMFDKQMDI